MKKYVIVSLALYECMLSVSILVLTALSLSAVVVSFYGMTQILTGLFG